MEESGRYRLPLICSRLLKSVFLLLLLCIVSAVPFYALEVDIFVSSFEVSVGDPLVISFTVPGANPADTALSFPAFPQSFAPSSSRKDRAQIENTGVFGTTHTAATVITREWIPSEAGSFSLGPFTITAQGDSVTLPPVYITVRIPVSAEYTALRWYISEGSARTGAPLRIQLEGFFNGTSGGTSCAAPENALLEKIPFPQGKNENEGSENGWKIVALYNWTPLKDGWQELPSATFEYIGAEGNTLKLVSQSRAVSVSLSPTVTPKASISKALTAAFSSLPPVSTDSRITEPLPAPIFPPDITAELSLGPWQKGNYAPILASLRHAEYTHLFPHRYRSARISAEESLGLGETSSVPPSAWKSWCVIGAVVFVSLALFLKLVGIKKTFLRFLSHVAIFISILLVISAVYIYTRDLSSAGVSTGGALLHVPEYNSTVVDTLQEGSSVHIVRKSLLWVYVETDTAVRGWLPSSQVLLYTTTE